MSAAPVGSKTNLAELLDSQGGGPSQNVTEVEEGQEPSLCTFANDKPQKVAGLKRRRIRHPTLTVMIVSDADPVTVSSKAAPRTLRCDRNEAFPGVSTVTCAEGVGVGVGVCGGSVDVGIRVGASVG